MILSELAETKVFVFRPTGPELTEREVCEQLIGRGISEADLETRPVDIDEHEDHRAELRAHLADVHAHIERLRAAKR